MTGERRDDLEVEALLTDRYIDSLLAARDRRARPAPTDPLPASDVRGATHRLEAELPRVHPSFRFEERLAATLQHAADHGTLPIAAGGEAVVSFPQLGPGPEWVGFDPFGEAPADPADPPGLPRPILIGGAVASAALSVAGAALVAWRLSRGEGEPMTRAVRAVNRLRSDAAKARLA